MKRKTYIVRFAVALLFLVLAFPGHRVAAQQVPYYPFSYRVFSPLHFNPAYAGSREFIDAGAIARIEEDATSYLLYGDTRLTRPAPAYFVSNNMREYTSFGIGGSLYHEKYGSVSNTGAMAAASYHIPLTRSRTSYLSVGASFRGIYNSYESYPPADSLSEPSDKSMFYPNMDFGMYFYSSQFYAGVSACNFLGNPGGPDTYDVPVSRQYFVQAGYKLLLSQSLNIVLEPSLLVIADDSTTSLQDQIVHPVLKLYMSDFVLGGYYDDNTKVTFFFQYRFPRIYIGTWFDIPLKTAFYLEQPAIEITLGVNLRNKTQRGVFEGKW